MKTRLIGIAGHKGSGKDTVASMLTYIIDNGTKANFNQWLSQKFDNNLPSTGKRLITHFADPMKDILSALFNISREYFDDRLHKDETLYCCDTGKFMTKIDTDRAQYKFIGKATMVNEGLYTLLKPLRNCFYIRDLMQYFGTTVGRNMLYNGIWIDATRKRIKEILNKYGICIIPDVRFVNEEMMIHWNEGKILYVDRGENTDTHESETIDFEYDIHIKNNKSLISLYYQVLNIYKEELCK